LDALPEKKQQEIQRALHLFSLGQGLPRSLREARNHVYRFWETQPVPRLDGADDGVVTRGPLIEAEGPVRTEPFSLPDGFRWDNLELSSQAVLKELCTLLNENYLEQDDNTVRFDFSPEYLQWALQPPNWSAQWHCGIRVVSSNKLVGFIAAVPAKILVYEVEKHMVQVQFLCVHKKLRLKRMTPVLIRELTRRVNQQGLYQSRLRRCRRAAHSAELLQVPKTLGLRPAAKGDLAEIHTLLQAELRKFQLSKILSLQEVEHWLLPRENVVDTYVVEGPNGTLTGVVSFYSIFSRLLNQPVHAGLRTAHLLFVVSTATNSIDLMEDTLILAKSKGCDVFSALDVMDNSRFLEQLKFSIDDSSLNYYLYNWMCPKMSPNKVGLVLPS
ncbi:unnamed protein product, partial [Tetraodon nigroviridis]